MAANTVSVIVICLLLSGAQFNGYYVVDATLTVSPVIACPGDTVRVTCDTAPTNTLRWTISYQGGTDLSRAVLSSQIGMTLTINNDPGFGIEITATGSGSGITSSVLTFTVNNASMVLNGATIECTAAERDTITLQIPGSPPSTPNSITIDPNVPMYTRNRAAVVINWTPVNTADYYTVEISPSIDSGSRFIITTTNTTLTISYNTNYTLTVFASNCMGDSNTTTTTVRIAGCNPLPPLANGLISDYPNGVLGTVLSFQCNEGYLPTSDPAMATCQDNGSWDPIPACNCQREIESCASPTPATGVVIETYNSTVEDSVIYFMCAEGLIPEERERAVCGSDGMWNPNPANHRCGDHSSSGLSGGAIAGMIVVFILILVALVVVAILVTLFVKRRGSKSERPTEMQSYPSGGASPPEDTLNGEYSKLHHPEGVGYNVLQHSDPHENKSSSDQPGGLVYAQVGNYDQSKTKKKASKVPTASELDDNKVQYSALTHKSAPPPEVAAIDKLLNLDQLAIQLKEVTSLWYELGELLGVPRETLNDIESHFTDIEDRRIEMFAYYLRTEPHPTWSHVAKALRKLHENTLAEKLENSYVTGQLPIQIDMDSVPSSSYKHSKGPPPPLPPKDFDFENSVDTSSPSPLILPPKPSRQGGAPSTTWKRAPPPIPQHSNDSTRMVAPPRPPKAGEPVQPPLPPKPKNL